MVMNRIERLAKTLRQLGKSTYKPPLDNLENEQQYKERWISIYIIYFTMFLISLGFSVIETVKKMLFSPLVGWWANKLVSIRIPVLVSLALFTLSSDIYSSLELFTDHRKYWMLCSRFLVGVSSGRKILGER